jgi:kynurenine formamidase
MTTSTSGLEYYDLSVRWGHGMPQWPSSPKGIQISTIQFHAMHGCQVLEWNGIQHRGTHMDAPIHVLENTPHLDDFEPWRFFGTGVVVSIPKGKWGVITAEDLENAEPKIQENDIVIINTGSHKNLGDNDDYYQYSPGLYKESAEWLVKKNVKLVGVDVQALDHPLGTKLVDHGPGPTHHHLFKEYKDETGREVMDDFPFWEISHKTLLSAGIPGIENIGGDVDKITGKRCTFMCYPWRWPGGDGCGVRVVAIVDPEQNFRIEKGEPYASDAS